MDTVAMRYKVDSPQNMQFCPILAFFFTSRGPHSPSMVPINRRKYAGECSWEKWNLMLAYKQVLGTVVIKTK